MNMGGGRFSSFGDGLTPEVLHRRVMTALERRVLDPTTNELRGYFDSVCAATTSPFSDAALDAISGASDEDLEQTALLLCHHDLDGDGKLSPTEFAAVIELTASQTGVHYDADHVEKTFRSADVDLSGFVDLNELLLLRKSGAR